MGTIRLKIVLLKNLFLKSVPLLLIILSGLLIFSCKNPYNYSSFYYNFDSQGMIKGKEYLFYPFAQINDSAGNIYSVILELRYNDRCSIRELPITLETGSLNSDSIEKRIISVHLFDSIGNMYGNGNYGIYKTHYTLIDSVSKDESLFISLSTPEKNCGGLLSLGILTEEK